MAMTMIHRALTKNKPRQQRFPILLLAISIPVVVALLFIFSNSISANFSAQIIRKQQDHALENKYLYWGNKIDCPGKHCDTCAGLGHQESSLRCGLEEAMFLQRTFVMPSRMCINPIHNNKGILHQNHTDANNSEERWEENSSSMDSLYDLELISKTVPVILDNSKAWYHVLSTSMKLGARGVSHVQGVNRIDLRERSCYSNLLLINRTASPLSWFMECKDRKNRNALVLPYSFLPSMAAKKLRDAADQISVHVPHWKMFTLCQFHIFKSGSNHHSMYYLRGRYCCSTKQSSTQCYGDDFFEHERVPLCLYENSSPQIKQRLGDYDAMHVRRGDILKTRKDRFGVERTLHPHLDRDTRPEFIIRRIAKWVDHGRTIFIGSNERTPGFFSPLASRYKLAYASNFSSILDPLIDNNYQLFMIERLIMMGAKTFIKTYKDEDTDLSLTDDPKKNTKIWQIPVYTMDEEEKS